jgi:hypothetical protein
MDLENRIGAFAEAGKRIRNYSADRLLIEAVRSAEAENPWFTSEHLRHALLAWGDLLEERHLTEWLTPYRNRLEEPRTPKTVGVVMAGNIPMVGFHDMLCVLLSGNRLLARLSSTDRQLLPAVAMILKETGPGWDELISFESGRMSGFDAVIATGSNNTSRYFEYYFGKYPHIIRKNRTSVALLTGSETDEELRGLAADIFLYFGLGCRNVSKLFLPDGYDTGSLIRHFGRYSGFFNHNKYRNNYDYHLSVFMVNQVTFYDGGFFLMREHPSPASPVSVIHYEYYEDPQSVERLLTAEQDTLQCVVSAVGTGPARVRPGQAQLPELADYADGIDTMAFLAEKI